MISSYALDNALAQPLSEHYANMKGSLLIRRAHLQRPLEMYPSKQS